MMIRYDRATLKSIDCKLNVYSVADAGFRSQQRGATVPCTEIALRLVDHESTFDLCISSDTFSPPDRLLHLGISDKHVDLDGQFLQGDERSAKGKRTLTKNCT